MPFPGMARLARGSEGWLDSRRRPSPAASGVVREAPSDSVLNQNLQYLVLRCRLRSKDSGKVEASQAVFHPQNAHRKRTGKTAPCPYFPGICKVHTGLFHRLPTDSPAPTNGRTALRSCDTRVVLRCNENARASQEVHCRMVRRFRF